MSFLSVFATMCGLASSVVMIPQIYKIFKRKSAKDISIFTYAPLVFFSFIWVLYGIEILNLPIIISNSAGTICLSLIVIGWFMYGR